MKKTCFNFLGDIHYTKDNQENIVLICDGFYHTSVKVKYLICSYTVLYPALKVIYIHCLVDLSSPTLNQLLRDALSHDTITAWRLFIHKFSSMERDIEHAMMQNDSKRIHNDSNNNYFVQR